ncbi:MAG: tetratricopeptide repeat protein, partial [Deltaproteobacteria bacterium]|nr:tetratricopeptide repeat protein [Deltaproteobacteria bacterium]
STHFAFKEALLKHDQWQQATKIHYEMDGRSAFTNGRYQDAVLALTRCMDILPNYYPAHILRGRSYAMLGEYEKAETDFNKAIFLSPDDSRGHRNIGFVYLLQGKTDAAEISLKKALKHAPEDKKTKEALTILMEQKKEAEKGMNKP